MGHNEAGFLAAGRVSTGIPGLDEVLCGGLPPASSYVIMGSGGTGKTILSLQFLREGLRVGERTVFISLSEPVAQLQRNAAALGWSLDGVRIVDLSPGKHAGAGAGQEYRLFAPTEVEREAAWEGIYTVVDEVRPSRLVIDSLTQLRYLSGDIHQFRKHVMQLVAHLNDAGCTTLLPFEPEENRGERSVELTVDGVLHLKYQISTGLSLGVRTVGVSKLRGSDFMTGDHALRISRQGLQVFPHRVERTAEEGVGERQIASNIPEMDELLCGGLEMGTTTLLSGPAGVGKTTLGLQFLSNLPASIPAALLTFEESRSSVLKRCRTVGVPVDEAVASGRLQITRINPLELYPDELLGRVRKLVEEDGVRCLMLDSLRGYELAMEEFGKAQMHVHNLLAYLGRKQVTTLLVAETEDITGSRLTATEIGVSHLADNILLLRYAEHQARLIKVVGCLKKRLGGFQPELREMRITTDGIRLSARLSGLSGILTGNPVVNAAGSAG